jgi:hypothetical protein
VISIFFNYFLQQVRWATRCKNTSHLHQPGFIGATVADVPRQRNCGVAFDVKTLL